MEELTTITGIGCLSALGINFRECMANLFKAPPDCINSQPFDPDDPETYAVFRVDNSTANLRNHLSDRGRTAQLAVAAAAEAIDNAGLAQQELALKRTGVCLGTTVGNSMNNEEFYRRYLQGEQPDMREMDRYFSSNPADVVAEEFNLNGPTMTIANACSSGIDAIGVGLSWLENDICDIVLAGGCDELSRISYLGFSSLLIHSESPCRPFDRYRNGLTLGEGAAVLVMEKKPVQNAIQFSVVSYATACDAYHLTAPDPTGKGLRKALSESSAFFDRDDLAFITAHGTGTFDNDKVEMTLLEDMFPKTPFFSTKGWTGHTLGAAGAIGAAITIGCMELGKIPASAGFSQLPQGGKNGPTMTPQIITGSTALCQALAFGGNNSVVVFRRHDIS